MTSEIIDLILKEIRARNYSEVKRLLGGLDEDLKKLEKLEKLQKFFDGVDKVSREVGGSNVISKDKIEELIREFKK